jgi:hypothetical protein
MKWSRPMAAMAAVAGVAFSVASLAADKEVGSPGVAPPQRTAEERPFGGPPPNSRSLKPVKTGRKCATAASVCELTVARPVAADCTCPEGDSKGAKGKVE